MKTSPRTSTTGAVDALELLRNRLDRPHRVRHVLAGLAVAARRRLHELAALVAQVDRQAVELHLGGVGDRRVVFAEAERLPDARVELLGAGRGGVGLGVDREHRHGMANRHQSLEDGADHALRRRVRRQQLRMLGLDRLQLLEQRVVVGVGDLRRVERRSRRARDARSARAARPPRAAAARAAFALRRRRAHASARPAGRSCSRSRSGRTRAARSRRCRAPRRRRAAERSRRWRAETLARSHRRPRASGG